MHKGSVSKSKFGPSLGFESPKVIIHGLEDIFSLFWEGYRASICQYYKIMVGVANKEAMGAWFSGEGFHHHFIPLEEGFKALSDFSGLW